MKIFERGRKILRKVLCGMSISVASLILQACYGIMLPDGPAEYGPPPPPKGTSIYGRVRIKETGEPIFGIKVSIEGTEYFEYTDKNGSFYLWLPVQDVYQLKIEDVDGPYNGGSFKEQKWTLKQNDTYTTLLIGMDADTQTNAE